MAELGERFGLVGGFRLDDGEKFAQIGKYGKIEWHEMFVGAKYTGKVDLQRVKSDQACIHCCLLVRIQCRFHV